MKRRLLLFFLFVSSLATAQNNIYRSGGITQTVGAPTFTPGVSGNIVAIDTVTGEWYVNPNRLSGASWISAGYRLTNISGSVPPAYTPTAHQSHFVVNAANQLYYWNGSSWQSVGGGGSTDALRLKFIVVNKSGGTLNKGEVVYVSGAQGNRVAVKKALASVDSLSANTLGVMDETVANNSEGYCVAEGLVSGINTSAFTEGAALYLSPTTAGAITQTKPTAPNHLVLIGYCVKSNAGSGEISVHIQNGYELGELHDVYIPAPTNGQVLTYNSTNSRWEAATVADQSATNEGIIGVSAGSATTSVITSNTSGANGVTVSAGTGISLSETTSTNGGTITVTNSAPDQTVSITNGGGVGVTGNYPSFTLTATDQSVTNEIQRLDTFSLSGQTLRASLLNDGVAASSITLPIVDVVAGTNVTVTKSNGVATVSATGGGGGGGTVTGTGVAGRAAFWRSTSAISSDANFAWDSTNVQLNIGAPSVPTARVNIKGSGNLAATTSLRITNSSNTELARMNDAGSLIVGAIQFNGFGEVVSSTGQGFASPGTNRTMRMIAGNNNNATDVAGVIINAGTISNRTASSSFQGVQLTSDLQAPAGSITSFTMAKNSPRARFGLTTYIGYDYDPTLDVAPTNHYAAIFRSGLVGIGLSAPNASIHVQGSNNTSSTYSLIVTNSGGSTTTPAICAQNDKKVGIGTNSVDSGATLEVDGTTGGILFPRLTTTQRDALTPVNGLMIYNTTDNKFQGYAGGAWVDLH